MRKKLTEKEKMFCKQYLICGYNASEAVRKAGYSEKAAKEVGSRMLTKANIQEEIKRLRANIEETLNISKEKVFREQAKLAFCSIAHLHNTWIERKDFDALTDDQKDCIQEISTQVRRMVVDEQEHEVEFIKVKLFDKQKALDSLAKGLGYNEPEKLIVDDGRDKMRESFPFGKPDEPVQ